MKDWTERQRKTMADFLDATEEYVKAWAPEMIGVAAKESEDSEVSPFEEALGWFLLGLADEAIENGSIVVTDDDGDTD